MEVGKRREKWSKGEKREERGKEMEIPSLFGPGTATGHARSLHHMHIRPPRERKVGPGGRGLFGWRFINQALCYTLRA